MFESLLETIAGGMNLSAEQCAFIRSLWTPRQFRKGQFFQRVGEITTHGAFVVRGCFRTYAVEASGVESIIHFSPERTFIGDITSAVTEQPTLYAVDAIEPSTTLTIDLASPSTGCWRRFPTSRAATVLVCSGRRVHNNGGSRCR